MKSITEPRAASASQEAELQTLTGSQIIWDTLVHEGVSVVFGYPGGAIMPAYDAMPGYPIRHVLVRHEQGAAHMADGYARASGGVGVCIATSGPGATNLVTGIANAMMDSIPMVCITGQVSSHLIGSDGFQEVDFTGVTLPITKHNILVHAHRRTSCRRFARRSTSRAPAARARWWWTSPKTRSKAASSIATIPRPSACPVIARSTTRCRARSKKPPR